MVALGILSICFLLRLDEFDNFAFWSEHTLEVSFSLELLDFFALVSSINFF